MRASSSLNCPTLNVFEYISVKNPHKFIKTMLIALDKFPLTPVATSNIEIVTLKP